LAAHWKNLAALLRLPLGPSFVLTDRTDAASEFREWLSGAPSAVAIEAPSPMEVLDFIAGWTASLDEPEQTAVASRAVIVEEREAWRALAASDSRLLLISSPQLELEPELAVRDVLEDINSEEIFRGFEMGVMNQRGCYWKSLTEGGAQERELASKYQKHADNIRGGWPLLAAALQRLADGYIHDAKREDERLHQR
jgi:hypothetical protein